VIGGIELGGTKVVVAVAEPSAPERPVGLDRFPTTSPEETLARVQRFFAGWDLDRVGIASFGPLDLRGGAILPTPKAAWSGFALRARTESLLGVPCTLETDVNAAALAEARFGRGRAADPVLYLTVGTGIGGGLIANGAPIHGLMHPEIGHLPMPPADDDPFAGVCPFHRRCLEGLASGPAIEARAGRPAPELRPTDPIWDRVAAYLAHGLAMTVLVVSPERIVLGGGVMEQAHLFPKIRAHLRALLHPYLPHRALDDEIDRYVVPAGLRDPGVIGALLLALLPSRDIIVG